MIIRLKIVGCLDIVVEDQDYMEVLRGFIDILTSCPGEARVFIHELTRGEKELVDNKLLFSSRLEDILNHMLQQRDQP
ncbi:MAG: hypothetical protein B6U89_02090 [Desulfurococcales archaeon ex4484_58]|nr:MAG: hypothetical protein B6U89_02090 [Desulfurococcales archaeon ex4484_58]